MTDTAAISEQFECDLLVVGAGMAGLSAAAKAAEGGASVIVAEKGTRLGGSAWLSGGFLWTMSELADPAYRARAGYGELAEVITRDFPEAADWVKSRGTEMTGPARFLTGEGYQIDIRQFLLQCRRTIEASGGNVVLNVDVRRLVTNDGKVVGADVRDESTTLRVLAPFTLLATGGFQADRQLRAELIHPNAADLPVRSNPWSDGGGIRLGRSVSAAVTSDNRGFYGHLLCSPLPELDLEQAHEFSMYHSFVSLLLNLSGVRFTDESRGDNWNSQALVSEQEARALLIWDSRTDEEVTSNPRTPVSAPRHQYASAIRAGAHGLTTDRLEDLAAVAEWGFDGTAIIESVREFNKLVQQSPQDLQPPRTENRRPINEPPFYALEVKPGITFTNGGLEIDEDTRAISADGNVVPGLLVAGADIGNVFKGGYGGGLAMALTFGLRSAETARQGS